MLHLVIEHWSDLVYSFEQLSSVLSLSFETMGKVKVKYWQDDMVSFLAFVVQDLFNRGSRKVRSKSLMIKPDSLPKVNVFEQSLTFEEEENMARVRRWV